MNIMSKRKDKVKIVYVKVYERRCGMCAGYFETTDSDMRICQGCLGA